MSGPEFEGVCACIPGICTEADECCEVGHARTHWLRAESAEAERDDLRGRLAAAREDALNEAAFDIAHTGGGEILGRYDAMRWLLARAALANPSAAQGEGGK